ncbi:MAG: protein kinase [Phycisphaerae bacterium]|nr:protein kinase [Phycisphaerae bacterium]
MTRCLDHELLERFAARQCSAGEGHDVEAHLLECPSCRHRVETCKANEQFLGGMRSVMEKEGLEWPSSHSDHDTTSNSPRQEALTKRAERLAVENHNTAPTEQALEGYEILREIRRGGQGVVYKAIQTATKRAVALKVLAGGPDTSPRQRLRFEREVDLAASLQHPNIVTIHDSGVHRRQYYITMEYIRGERLNEYVREQRLSLKNTLVLFAKVCEAVNHAHQRGIIHRDLKPGNILVDGDGEPHVLDFGLAKAADSRAAGAGQMTMTGEFMGTLAYASPEQAKGDPSQMDIRTDVYSLGVIIYEMLTGGYPYHVVGSLSDVLRNITEAEPVKPSSISRTVDDEVETIVLKSLAKDRRRRYQSAGELGRDVQYYLAGKPIEAKRESGMYLLRKHLLRYKVPVAVAMSFLLVMGVSSITGWKMYLTTDRALMAEQRAKEALVRSDYFNKIALAQTALEDNDIRRLDRLLEQCPSEHRSWEYDRLCWLADRSVRTLEGHAGVVYSAAISPDGHLIATGGADGSVTLWNAHTGERVSPLEGHTRDVRSVAFSPDSQKLVSAGDDKTVQIWDVVRYQASRAPLVGHDGNVTSVTFNHDGSSIASGCTAGSIRIWNVETGEEKEFLPRHANHVNSVALSRDGQWLASGSNDKTVRIWDVSSRNIVQSLNDLPCGLLAVAFSPDGHHVVAGGVDGFVSVWEWHGTGNVRALNRHDKRVHSVTYSPDGKWIISGGCDNSIRLQRADSGAEVAVLRGHRDIVNSVVVSQDNWWIVSASHDGTAKLWDLGAARFQDGNDFLQLKGHSDMVLDIAFTPDGSRLVSGGKDSTVRVWDTHTGEEMLTLKGHRGFVESVDVSPNGERIASASHDGTLRTWDLTNGKLVRALSGHDGPVLAVGFRPDGERIVSGGKDAFVRMWNAKTGDALFVLRGHEAPVRSVSYCSDDSRIVSASEDGTLILWDAENGDLLRQLGGSDGAVLCATFSPDGARITSGASNGSITIWDAHSGEAWVISSRPYCRVHDVVFSPDGKRIASCGDDQMLRLWDVLSGNEILTYRADEDTVSAVAFSPDGKSLATGGSDTTIKIWETTDPPDGTGKDNIIERRNTVAAARELVDELFQHCILAKDVKDHLETDADLSSSIRAAALELTDCWGNDPLRLRQECSGIVEDPGRDPAEYERALEMVEAARKLDPKNGPDYLRALGMAQYRIGQFQDAVTSLDSFCEASGRDDPRALAFLAMAQFRSGEKEAAVRSLDECRALLAQPGFSIHTHLKPVLREAEDLICPESSSTDNEDTPL